MPLKSFNFYGDSQINDFLSSGISDSMSEYDNQKSPKDRMFLDYTYGFFRNSQTNFDLNLNFYSIRLRPLLFKMYNFLNYYTSYLFSSLNSKILIIFYTATNYIIFKLDLFYNISCTLLVNFSFFNYFYLFFIKFLLSILNFFLSNLNIVILILYKVQIFITISDFSINDSFFYNFFFYIKLNLTNCSFVFDNLRLTYFLFIYFICYLFFILLLILF